MSYIDKYLKYKKKIINIDEPIYGVLNDDIKKQKLSSEIYIEDKKEIIDMLNGDKNMYVRVIFEKICTLITTDIRYLNELIKIEPINEINKIFLDVIQETFEYYHFLEKDIIMFNKENGKVSNNSDFNVTKEINIGNFKITEGKKINITQESFYSAVCFFMFILLFKLKIKCNDFKLNNEENKDTETYKLVNVIHDKLNIFEDLIEKDIYKNFYVHNIFFSISDVGIVLIDGMNIFRNKLILITILINLTPNDDKLIFDILKLMENVSDFTMTVKVATNKQILSIIKKIFNIDGDSYKIFMTLQTNTIFSIDIISDIVIFHVPCVISKKTIKIKEYTIGEKCFLLNETDDMFLLIISKYFLSKKSDNVFLITGDNYSFFKGDKRLLKLICSIEVLNIYTIMTDLSYKIKYSYLPVPFHTNTNEIILLNETKLDVSQLISFIPFNIVYDGKNINFFKREQMMILYKKYDNNIYFGELKKNKIESLSEIIHREFGILLKKIEINKH